MGISVIFWDFDGVLLRSNEVRERGFTEVLTDFPAEQVDQLLAFHKENGGLSRYVKFRYFFESVRGEELSEEKLNWYAKAFSEIMREALIDPTLLIKSTNEFVRVNSHLYDMHIVSGSDQMELRFLCDSLGLSRFFISIHGSPTPKCKLVENLMRKYRYETDKCLLIGDAINDYEAAKKNNIGFQAFGNSQLNVFSSHSLI